ncbi:MAG: TetR/AcrR family transcriptional regulator [Citromicrobium sp.]|nr:MAG: TetR/AcrR family transcriptional regulator [Citromicrobium sp.]
MEVQPRFDGTWERKLNAFECDRLENRRTAIVVAARALFLEQGYERTTLGHVVERAGGSLATVYKLFGNKDGLLRAVVFENAASGETLIRDAASAGLTPAATLHRIAHELRDHFLAPDIVALMRMVIARSVNDVDVARSFYERTSATTQCAMSDVFSALQRDALMPPSDVDVLTDAFLGLILSDALRDAISHGAAEPLSGSQFDARTELFLRGAGIATESGELITA